MLLFVVVFRAVPKVIVALGGKFTSIVFIREDLMISCGSSIISATMSLLRFVKLSDGSCSRSTLIEDSFGSLDSSGPLSRMFVSSASERAGGLMADFYSSCSGFDFSESSFLPIILSGTGSNTCSV